MNIEIKKSTNLVKYNHAIAELENRLKLVITTLKGTKKTPFIYENNKQRRNYE